MGLDAVTIQDIVSLASDAGIIGLLIYVLLGGARKWWVWGWTYEEAIRDRDEWKDLALSGTDLAERAVSLAAVAPKRRTTTRKRVAAEGE